MRERDLYHWTVCQIALLPSDYDDLDFQGGLDCLILHQLLWIQNPAVPYFMVLQFRMETASAVKLG